MHVQYTHKVSHATCSLQLHSLINDYLLTTRTAHARGKAEAAMGAAQKAQEECRLARVTAKEFSPSFQHRKNGECATIPIATINTPEAPILSHTVFL